MRPRLVMDGTAVAARLGLAWHGESRRFWCVPESSGWVRRAMARRSWWGAAGSGLAWCGRAGRGGRGGHGWDWHGTLRSGRTRLCMSRRSRYGLAWSVGVRCGTAGPGKASRVGHVNVRLGLVWRGLAGRGEAVTVGQGTARPGLARPGGLGKAGLGEASQGLFSQGGQGVDRRVTAGFGGARRSRQGSARPGKTRWGKAVKASGVLAWRVGIWPGEVSHGASRGVSHD